MLAASFANLLSWRLTEEEALHDSLTGLPNRVSLLDALEKALDGRSRSGAAVLFIDLDNFKDANDAFGHHIGDEVLIALGRRLSRQLRPGDVLARLGGDEFAILISTLATSTRVDAAEAKATGERLLGSFNSPIVIGDITITVLASMGLALADETTTSTDLLRNADLAMYEAKRAGGGRLTMYAPAMHTAVVQRTELEAELRTALDADELVLHYQPIVALRGERVVGTEALIRWQHPVRGLIPPADFIGVAEQSGLIVSLGAWVIRTACAQTARWQAYAPDEAPLTVAVNLSPIQLLDRTLVATVAEALHDSGLDPSSLCLEITEGSMIKDFDIAVPTLHALRTLGVSLALDDFGTGHSSLSYLQRLPVGSVKIDRSFVGNLEHESPNAQIVLAIIKLAHTLGLSVTAEGVETQVQLDIVTAMGSETAQGFFFERPVEAAALTEVLRQRAACPAKPLRAHDRVTSSVQMP